MNSRDLTPEQARLMAEKLRPTLGYLTRLQRRMDEEKFPAHDPVYVTVSEAQAAMQDLCMVLHYRTASGVWVR